jgi:hypothetical protein
MTTPVKNIDPASPGRPLDSDSDDIDLLLLLERCLIFFKKYKWVFLIAILLGIGSGLYMYRSLPKVYKSRMVLHSFLLTNQELITIAGNWNDLLKRHEYASLAQIFHCPESLLYRVKQIKTQEIQKIFTPTNPNGFTVEVMVTDNAVLDSLQTAIVSGFENTPYIRQRVDIKKANLAELIEKTSDEIARLDSTKKMMEDIISGKQRITSSLVIDGSSINRQLIEMNQKLMSFKEDLNFGNAIQVFQGFSKFSKPAGPKLYVWLGLGLIGFLALAYIGTLFHSINSKLKARRKKPSSL